MRVEALSVLSALRRYNVDERVLSRLSLFQLKFLVKAVSIGKSGLTRREAEDFLLQFKYEPKLSSDNTAFGKNASDTDTLSKVLSAVIAYSVHAASVGEIEEYKGVSVFDSSPFDFLDLLELKNGEFYEETAIEGVVEKFGEDFFITDNQGSRAIVPQNLLKSLTLYVGESVAAKKVVNLFGEAFITEIDEVSGISANTFLSNNYDTRQVKPFYSLSDIQKGDSAFAKLAPIKRGQKLLVGASEFTEYEIGFKKQISVLSDLFEVIVFSSKFKDFPIAPGITIVNINSQNAEVDYVNALKAVTRAKRLSMTGVNVVVAFDNLADFVYLCNTRCERGGECLCLGVSLRALHVPLEIFISAQENKRGGSITLIALTETKNETDTCDAIFHFFEDFADYSVYLNEKMTCKPPIEILKCRGKVDEKTAEVIKSLKKFKYADDYVKRNSAALLKIQSL